MNTTLSTKTKSIAITADGPFTIIGEKINPTGRKKLASALQARDFNLVCELAMKQVKMGADVLDINMGVPGEDEAGLIAEAVRTIEATVEVPLCLDSANPTTLSAALEACTGKPLINSVTGEDASLDSILPLVKAHGAAVIGLTMDERGIPADAEKRLAIAEKILERAAKMGIASGDVVIDPLVMTVGAESLAGRITLRTIAMLRKELGVNINLGASNVSFGLPERHTINQAFLAMAIQAGATCAITDPLKLGLTIKAIDLLRGVDEYGGRYIRYYREHIAA